MTWIIYIYMGRMSSIVALSSNREYGDDRWPVTVEEQDDLRGGPSIYTDRKTSEKPAYGHRQCHGLQDKGRTRCR